MAGNADDNKGTGVSPDASAAVSNYYKYMANILVPARMRGMYLKPLEKITPDAKVPFTRVMVAMFGIAFVVIGFFYVLSKGGEVVPYIITPMVVMMVCLILLFVIYMLSSRNESMLSTAVNLNWTNLSELYRGRKNLTIHTLGVKSVAPDGTIEFDDESKGVAYVVKGQLSNSTLPNVADFIDMIRGQYYVTRPFGSQEMRITSIEPNRMETQRNALLDLYDKHVSNGDPASAWIADMADLQGRYIDELVKGGNQLTMRQVVILSDESTDGLNRAIRAFENGARGGMYERMFPIETDVELDDMLRDVTLRSNVIGG